jgi:WD40 repeat protein
VTLPPVRYGDAGNKIISLIYPSSPNSVGEACAQRILRTLSGRNALRPYYRTLNSQSPSSAMNFRAFFISAMIVVSIPPAWALSPPEVSDIAKKITVRIDGGGSGTGVIVNQQGNSYIVLTNAHVVSKRKNNYLIQTFDGKTHQVNPAKVRRLPSVDLSLLEFSSKESYAIAEIGDSDELNEGMTLYVGGWAAKDSVNRERGYRFSEGRLSGRATNPENGYALIYSNVVKPGMSGSPIMNEEGRVVGINGKAVSDIRTGDVDYYGIPINIYLQLAKKPTPPPVTATPSPNRSAVVTKILPFSLSRQAPQPPKIDPLPKNITVTSVPQIQPSSNRPPQKFSLAATLTGHAHSIYTVAYSLDGKTLASGSSDRTIKIWDLATRQDFYTLNGHTDSVYSVAYSPVGPNLASGSADRTIKIWNVTTGVEIRTLKGHTDSVNSVAYSPDGQNLASGSWDKSIKIWDVTTGQEIYTLKGHSDAVDTLAYSPDGKTLVTGSWDKTIKIWDLSKGREIRTLTGHTQAIDALAYSPDGKTLASGSGDKTIKVWDAATGQEIYTLNAHAETIDALAYSPDGKTLASGSGDKTIKIWDAATGQELSTLTGANDSIYALAYNPLDNGKTLVSASGNISQVADRLEFGGGAIAIWQLSER